MKFAHFTRILPNNKVTMAINPNFVQLVQPYLEVDTPGNQGVPPTLKPSSKQTTLVIEGFEGDVYVVGSFGETIRNLESNDE